MNIRFTLIFMLTFIQYIGLAQSIWPGDVNNNGIVNKVDLIYLGYAFGETGSERTMVNQEWTAYDVPENWEGNFPSGVNFLYADCNGDGLVDELDAEIIIQNIGLSHDDILFTPDEVLVGIEGEDPACKFMNPPSAVPVDQLFSLEIGLGDNLLPIENMSGFTFILDINPQIVGINNTKITYGTNSWIDPNDEVSIRVEQRDLEEVRLKVAFTKKDRIPVSGAGSLGKISFLIEGDIVDLLVVDSVTFTIDSIILLNDELEPIPIVPDTLKVAIDRDLKVSTQQHPKLTTIGVYPNPNKGFLLIESSEVRLHQVEIINNLGQIVFNQMLSSQSFQSIDFQSLEKGLYWVKIHSNFGVKTEVIHKY